MGTRCTFEQTFSSSHSEKALSFFNGAFTFTHPRDYIQAVLWGSLSSDSGHETLTGALVELPYLIPTQKCSLGEGCIKNKCLGNSKEVNSKMTGWISRSSTAPNSQKNTYLKGLVGFVGEGEVSEHEDNSSEWKLKSKLDIVCLSLIQWVTTWPGVVARPAAEQLL